MEVNNEIAIQESGNYETFDRVNMAPPLMATSEQTKIAMMILRRMFVQLVIMEVSSPILHFDKSPSPASALAHQHIADAKIKIYS